MTVCTNDDVRQNLAPAKQGLAGGTFLGGLARLAQGATIVWRAAEEYYMRFQNRRRLEAMLELDDSILSDIGVTRDDVRWASRLPLSYRAGEELSRARGRRMSRSKT